MVDERTLRRPTFLEGAWIGLANGQSWSFRDHPPHADDEEHNSTLRAIAEAEDGPERLLAELTLAILLLSRNYDLTPAEFQAILAYTPGDPRLAEMQRGVREVAIRQCRALGRHSESDRKPAVFPTTHGSLANLHGRRNRADSSHSHRPN